jgi:uncharacterized protein (TIGR00268 family)
MSGVKIEVRGLGFDYPDGFHALDDVSFDAAPGECLGLVGPNGAGKSTLLLLLVGILNPSRGKIIVGGEELTARSLKSVRRRLGFAFQDPDDQLFMPTVGADVAFGPRNMGLSEEEVSARTGRALETVGIAHLADRPPFRLSGGEKRAAAIATVLAMEPEALILDEPTSSLDPRSRRRLLELLSSLPHTRIVATHDIDFAYELCDRVIVLSRGRVCAEGPGAAILGDADLMEQSGLELPRGLLPCPRCGARGAEPASSAWRIDDIAEKPAGKPAAEPKTAYESDLEQKYAALRSSIRDLGRVAVAFSGGVDSSLLCALARSELGDDSIAITLNSPLMPDFELEDARSLADLVGIAHVVIEESRIVDEVAANGPERCYHCKKHVFERIIEEARMRGFDVVLDGSNADDNLDYRPGERALSELRVTSPLREAGLTKEEVRLLSKRLELPTWDKSAYACLASRVPYGELIDDALLRRIEKSEDYLRGLGFKQVRVRAHGDIARIEVGPAERGRLYSESRMDEIASNLRELGFLYVCMELSGYERGSLNRALRDERILR